MRATQAGPMVVARIDSASKFLSGAQHQRIWFRRFIVVSFILLSVIGAVQAVWVAIAFGSTLTSEDQELLQVSSIDWLHLALPEPAFYGQSYGTTLEAVPSALARMVGLDPYLAMSLSGSVIQWSGWILFGILALRRNHAVLAIIAAAAPLLISNDYVLLSTFSLWFVGPGLAVASIAAYLWFRNSWARTAFLSVGFLASVWAPSALLIFAPVAVRFLVEMLSEHVAVRKILVRAAVIGAPGALWYVGVAAFYRANPNYSLHPSPGGFSVGNLKATISAGEQNFSILAPQLVHMALAFVIIATAVMALCLAARSWAVAMPALAFLVVSAIAAGSPRAPETALLLPGVRLFYFAPIALWLLALWAIEALKSPEVRISRRATLIAVAGIMSLALLTVGIRISTIERDWQLRSDNDSIFIMLHSELELACDGVKQAAEATGSELVVFLENNTEAYGCQAMLGDRLDTIFPYYDRRTPVVEREATLIRDGFVVVGEGFSGCRIDGSPISGCSVITSSTVDGSHPVYIESGGRPALEVLRDLGVPIRPF